jgi:asparagine synthetase B (glutamine-hydrolysing)
MCGIFGISSMTEIDARDLKVLAEHARQRGRDSSGLMLAQQSQYLIYRSDSDVKNLMSRVKFKGTRVALGHSRLITNGLVDNQPVLRDDVCVIHNGIVVNDEAVWNEIDSERRQEIDTEVIAAIVALHVGNTGGLSGASERVLELCKGVISAAVAVPKLGKMIVFSNNGSLYTGYKNKDFYFPSEEYPLTVLGCESIRKVIHEEVIVDIPVQEKIELKEHKSKRVDLIPKFSQINSERSLLLYPEPKLKRCTKCILPETMPYISFDQEGVCNYCNNYQLRNVPKPKEEIFDLLEKYRRKGASDCIVPFSGGRDSCYGLHLIVKELGMNPITYTYDWGMVTDLGRRNISRMCAELGVENIIIADDIAKKRRNIKRNLEAWLKAPHLGMISILTAGDKHFFRHVESVKKQTGIDLNLWGVNPLEVTHFKAGFLGVPPDFEEERVYSHGWQKQLEYQKLRFKEMMKSPGYFNTSLWDTLSGEYYRSFTEKKDYYHIFDYWRGDE